MVLTRLSICLVCSVGRLVVMLIAVATVVAVGKSSSMPRCSIRSNMLQLFAISSRSSGACANRMVLEVAGVCVVLCRRL